ncbi:hypothetical protein [Amnibacterium kyonggiense]|uniref:Universal stress protein family protein n=1 Tax=Amnibacterium kyonggiense TaxID=595671 RepID=A0A4R7FKI7_9MICO|nr:hypothetical protein [Amnibacterium kyonggiense]TDS76891.1 hypothetical protein CLV52_1830 [Amnibacterium kyonggiense]
MTATAETLIRPGGTATQVERILLAADDAGGTVASAEWLARRAARAPIAVEVAVVESRARIGRAYGVPEPIAGHIAERMGDFLRARLAGVPIDRSVLDGDVRAALLGAAEHADLLVVGCNRALVWQHLPIAAEPRRPEPSRRTPTLLVPVTWYPGDGPVVAAVQDVDEDEPVLARAADEAEAADTPLLLLRRRVLAAAIGIPVRREGVVRWPGPQDARRLDEAAERLRATRPGLVVETELDHGGAGGAEPSIAAAELVVLPGTPGAATASALRGVIGRMSRPVAVVPVEAPAGRIAA